MKPDGDSFQRRGAFQLRHLFKVRPGEARRVALMAALLFFLLAANNLIKIVRDSLFLSRFPIAQLPYVYLLAALVAGVLIATYTRYTVQLPLSRIILGSLAWTIASVVGFWVLVVVFSAGWVLYAYYVWSAIVGLVLVAQFWMLANGIFNPRDGKRLFGVVTAGGTVGATMGGLAAHWIAGTLADSKHLLWLVVAFLVVALGLTAAVLREQQGDRLPSEPKDPANGDRRAGAESGVMATMFSSSYLKSIAALIFVSVVVSTLIDYQFKAAAKEAYPTADSLAQFFGSYYAWLGAVTLLAQLWLTGKLLVGLGLTPSLLVLPVTLFAASVGLLIWPGLAAATATRMAETTLRTSIHQSGMQILFLPIGDGIKKKVKVFLDVFTERLGDGIAAAIILSVALLAGGYAVALLSYFALGLVLVWLALVYKARRGYLDALRTSLVYRDVSFASAPVDFTDRATLEAVFNSLDEKNEPAVRFALDLAEQMDRPFVATRLPLALLRHESAEVRRRALALLTAGLETNVLALVFEVLTSKNNQLRADAIDAIAAGLRKPGAMPALGAAAEALLASGVGLARPEALKTLPELMTDRSVAGERNRVEAVRAMGEWIEPEHATYLAAAIREDPSLTVVRQALAAAAKGKYLGAIAATISRLADNSTRAAARDALIQYGELAVKGLRTALSDERVVRQVRLNIPATLSKIPAQEAMNALMGGLLEEDRGLRFKAILAVEEMARRFPNLKVDRDIVESAIMSDAQLYCRRLVFFAALFDWTTVAPKDHDSLLFYALKESMERVLERVMWLLALIYPAQDIRRAWAGLNAADRLQRAHAIEFIDNLLSGDIKKYLLPLYSDGAPEQRLLAARFALGVAAPDRDTALRALLSQQDRWLRVAALWEIGRRKISGFGDVVAQLSNSDDAVLRETAGLVARGE